jgi:hypothetical protein
MVFEGTLDECIRQFMSKPTSQRHLYEIHTSPQAELITAVLSADQIVELARLRDFLWGKFGYQGHQYAKVRKISWAADAQRIAGDQSAQ